MNKVTSKLTIIIPAYNAEKTINKALDSVLQFSDESIKIIVVNDGSTDNTAEILKQYEEEHLNITVINKDNEGVSTARNTALFRVNSEYFSFLDADDELSPNFINVIPKVLDREPDMIIYGMRFKYLLQGDVNNVIDYRTQKSFILTSSTFSKHFIDLFELNYLSSSQNKIYKTSTYLGNVHFNNEMVLLEDFNFVMEALKFTKNIYICDEVLYIYNNEITESQLSRRPNINYFKNFEIIERTIKEFLQTYDMSEDIPRSIIRGMVFRFYLIGLEKDFIDTDITTAKKYKRTTEFVNNELVRRNIKNSKVNRLGVDIIILITRLKLSLLLFTILLIKSRKK